MEVKSPAVLFYTSDFITGVSNLTMEERGQYITLLCLQHQLGHLPLKTIKLNVNNVTNDVLAKFKTDEQGNYYNERMQIESDKRDSFVNSRYLNGYKGGRPKKAKKNHKDNHIGNENENDNVSEYGLYKRVLLTNKQYERLIKDFNKDFVDIQINLLDEYIQSNNNKNGYTDFNLVLRKSIREKWFVKKEDKPYQSKEPEWLNKQIEEEALTTEEEEKMKEMLSEFK